MSEATSAGGTRKKKVVFFDLIVLGEKTTSGLKISIIVSDNIFWF